MTNDFIDKQLTHLPTSHRFYELNQRINGYRGVDILSFVDDNELLRGLIRTQSMQQYKQLLAQNPPPQACVLIVITDEKNPRLLLTRRASFLSSHAGEVSLVGGKRDETDKSSADVALREAHEEVGLHQNDCRVLGYLPMQLSKKGLLVRPVVACVAVDVVDRLIPSEDEIARLFWLPFEVLKQPPVDHVFDGQLGQSSPNQFAKLHTPAWIYEAEVIWGLTGRILASLLQIGFGIDWRWYYRIEQ